MLRMIWRRRRGRLVDWILLFFLFLFFCLALGIGRWSLYIHTTYPYLFAWRRLI